VWQQTRTGMSFGTLSPTLWARSFEQGSLVMCLVSWVSRVFLGVQLATCGIDPVFHGTRAWTSVGQLGSWR
jgi:hypothetical protein